MDTTQLIQPAFWENDSTGMVMENTIIGQQVDELKQWVSGQRELDNHLLFASSGSTGEQKWIALSKRALLQSAQAVNSHLSVDKNDRWMLSLPIFHVGGFGILARAYAAGIGVSTYQEKWDAAAFAHQLDRDGCTLTSMVPTQLADLVQLNCPAPASLRGVVIGGGHLDHTVYQQAVKLGWPALRSYGMSEAASQIATELPEHIGQTEPWMRPLAHWQLRNGEMGLLQIKGQALFSGYVRSVGENFEFHPVDKDDWFSSNDVVSISERGIKFDYRLDNLVKVLGELVNVTSCEAHLRELAAADSLIADRIAVVAIAHQRRGHQLVAVIEGELEYSQLEILLAKYHQQANSLEALADVVQLAEFPRSPLGKIRYQALAKLVSESLAR
ncbi:AMP-binding protein [Persicirhabdus sediminis]|uniref:AMP-binding protein n=1 Tax=Persicirhabdus sediminis TaxID=454144 RepID=A0A8J7SIL5_9BACT|nr:AMP-binding protein [Persicirhabdus sediminis]MBK1789640.1 AMP-binding protein [Persicirhabdus sediminis]